MMTASPDIQAVLSRLKNVKMAGGQYSALCPAHGDKDNSLSISGNGEGGKILLKCFAGCDTESAVLPAMGLTIQDLMPVRETPPRRRDKAPALTVEDLSRDKAIPAEALQSFGVKDTTGGVSIRYLLMDGADAPRQRLRTALSAKEGSLWKKGTGSPVPYGLDRLLDAREEGYIVLVEGESDCWTLWHHGIPALGIPGADATGKILADYLIGIPTVYYWKEPDQGGDTFARGIKIRLSGIGYRGEVREVRMVGAKDPNELHKKSPDTFKKSFQAALDASTKIDLADLPGKTRQERELERDPEDIADFLERQFEPNQDLIGNGLLAKRSCLVIRGWKKSFKSFDASQLALCGVLQKPFYAFPVLHPSRVLVIQGEISEARYQERLKLLLSHHADEGITVADLRGRMFVKNRAVKIDGDSFEILKGWVTKIQPDILILDPIYKFLRYADENNPSSMRIIFDRLDELKGMGCSVVVCHHNRKKHAQESEESFGSSRGHGWEEYADSIMALRRDGRDKLRVKVNYEFRNAEEPPDMVLVRNAETMWGRVEGYATDGRKKATNTDARDALADLGGVAESKKALAGKIMEKWGVSDKTAEARIDGAVRDGLMKIIDGKGNCKGYKVVIPKLTETLPYRDD